MPSNFAHLARDTGVGTFAEHHGLPDALAGPGHSYAFRSIYCRTSLLLTLFGVPMPPFLVPKWIRTQDREHRRLKRVARKRRWQDPQVKKSEISANVSGTLIAVGTVAVVLVVGIWSMSANGGS